MQHFVLLIMQFHHIEYSGEFCDGNSEICDGNIFLFAHRNSAQNVASVEHTAAAMDNKVIFFVEIEINARAKVDFE